MKNYTSIEQAKKLVEFLPIESADMYYCYGMDIHTKGWSFDDTPTIIDNSNRIDVHADIPCWSLAALLSVIPKPDLVQNSEGTWLLHSWVNDYPWSVGGYSNPVDACVEMIIKLRGLNLL